MTQVLRAVGYPRTSGEGQRDNTSISTQMQDIERFCATQGWKFLRHYVDECRSGSTIVGRDEFIRMMKDAANGEFDVVVPWDTTRFGRDGMDILESARTLKRDFCVDVVDTKGGFDSRRRGVINFLHAGLAEEERLRILERTKRGKIARAKMGHPIGPQRPYGRVWDKQTSSWSVDDRAQRLVEDAAQRYLDGEPLLLIAQRLGVNGANLRKVLMGRCGTTWEQRIQCSELGIDEIIPCQVPPLLDEPIINAIHAKAHENTRFRRSRQPTHKYLLSRCVFCQACGYALTTHRNQDDHRYYRHLPNAVLAKLGMKTCPNASMIIGAGDLEETVFLRLYDLFGNAAAVREAVQRAIPNRAQVDDVRAHLDAIGRELKDIGAGRDRILALVMKGKVNETEAERQLDKAREREALLQAEVARLSTQLENTPTAQEIDQAAAEAYQAFRRYSVQMWAANYGEMKWEDRRSLVEMVFNGKTADGRKMGVYITERGARQGRKWVWSYRILGRIVDLRGSTQEELGADGAGWKQKELLQGLGKEPRRLDGCLYRPSEDTS